MNRHRNNQWQLHQAALHRMTSWARIFIAVLLLVFLLETPSQAENTSQDPRLKSIEEAYIARKKRLLDPLNRQYLEALERHKREVMKSGDLEKANKVQEFIDAFKLAQKVNEQRVSTADDKQSEDKGGEAQNGSSKGSKEPNFIGYWSWDKGGEYQLQLKPWGRAARLKGWKDVPVKWKWKKIDEQSIMLKTEKGSYKIKFSSFEEVARCHKAGDEYVRILRKIKKPSKL